MTGFSQTDTLHFTRNSEVNGVVHIEFNLNIFLSNIFTICTYLQSISKLSCHQADGNNGNNFGFVSFLANFYSLMVSLGSTGPCQLISLEKWGQSPLHLHQVYNIRTFINPKSSQSRVGAGCLRWQQRQDSRRIHDNISVANHRKLLVNDSVWMKYSLIHDKLNKRKWHVSINLSFSRATATQPQHSCLPSSPRWDPARPDYTRNFAAEN